MAIYELCVILTEKAVMETRRVFQLTVGFSFFGTV